MEHASTCVVYASGLCVCVCACVFACVHAGFAWQRERRRRRAPWGPWGSGERAEERSGAQVVRLLGDEYNDFPLASMHSISKGFYGECGRRGGYTEFVGFPAEVMAQLYKLASINLCSNLNGQICMALMMNPPQVVPLPPLTCC